MKLLLFDIDGTLIGSNGAGLRAMNTAAQELFGQGFTFDGIIAAGGLDPVLFAEAAANHGLDDHHEHHDRFCARYVEQLATDFERQTAQAAPKPGIFDLLDILDRRDDVTLGIVSGNYRVAAPIKLTAAGIDPDQFVISGYADDGPDRPSLVAHAMSEYARLRNDVIDPHHVIVIGDTPRDVHCAHANGCLALAVATGRYSMEELQETGADAVVRDLVDAGPLLELLDRS